MTARSVYLFERFRSIFNRSNEDETVHFVKYSQFENEKELSELFDEKKKSSISEGMNNGTKEEKLPPLTNGNVESLENNQDRNQITAWQAGWNVTNAIQVR